jgi:uncharacterized protein (DUF1330 family)
MWNFPYYREKLLTDINMSKSCYLIGNYKITNPDAYQAYVPAVLATLEAHGVKVVVADYESEPLEGEPQHVTVVLQFDSKSAARTWYNSPEYQEIISLRIDNTEGFILFADEFTMPE